MQEIEGNNILKMATWLRFLWQPRTQTADKQTIMTERKRERERGRITNVRDDKDPISSPDGTKAGRSQHWCHLSLQGPVRFSIRQSSCTRGWHATQALLMESRTKKSDVGGQWVKVLAYLGSAWNCVQWTSSCHRVLTQAWTAALRNGKMSKQFMDMQGVKAKLWMTYTTLNKCNDKQKARLI